MINPLEAMQIARSANQNRPPAIMPTGSVSQGQNLQRQQLNTGSIGTRMDGRAPQMVAVDPNMYAERKQARDFEVLNAERNRQNELQKQQMAYDNAIKVAESSNKMAMEQEAAKQKLADKRYESLRLPAARIIATANRWQSGDGLKYRKDAYTNYINQQALGLGDEVIQAEHYRQKELEYGGNVPNSEIKVDPRSQRYRDIAMGLLQRSPNFSQIQQEAQSYANRLTREKGQEIMSGYNATIGSISKLGYSLPEVSSVDSDTTLSPPKLDMDSGLIVPPVRNTNNNVTADSGNPIAPGSIVGGAINVGKNVGEAALNNAPQLALGGSMLYGLEQATKGDPKIVEDAVKKANTRNPKSLTNRPNASNPLDIRPEGGAASRAPDANKKGSLSQAEADKRLIDTYKKIAKSTGGKVPADDKILKMKPDEMQKFIQDSRKGIITRYLPSPKFLKNPAVQKFLKFGGYGLLAYEGLNILGNITEADKENLDEVNNLAVQANERLPMPSKDGVTVDYKLRPDVSPSQ